MALEMEAAGQPEPTNKMEANSSKWAPAQQLDASSNSMKKDQNISINEQEANNNINHNTSKQQEQQQQHELELELMGRETQELRTKTRRLQLEVEEKDEIIVMLRDELEVTKETSDKLGKENLRLIKDSRRVKFLEDENDFLQDRVAAADRLEQETKKLKERLVELDYLRLRVTELEEDRQRAQDECQESELAKNEAEQRAARVAELEQELVKWKLFSQELEAEKSSMQAKLLESIEQEAQLAKTNTKVEAEVRRLKDLVRAHEEQRDEQEASNSLILSSSVAEDLKSLKIDEEEDGEEQQLRKRLEELEQLVGELRQTNQAAAAELEANRRLISELRQDLACEKNLALKLTNQLASFTKQIKSLDKHYFPMHDVPLTLAQQVKNKQQQHPRDNTSNSTNKLISIKTTTMNSRACGGGSTNGEKESSRSGERGKANNGNSNVTSSDYSHKRIGATKKPKEVLLCVNDHQKKTSQANSSSNNGREEADNETATKRQQVGSGVGGGVGSNLSAKELPKNHSPLDNAKLVGKQSISEQEPRLGENESRQTAENGRSCKLNISTSNDEQQTEQADACPLPSPPPSSPVTNKSANRGDDESLARSKTPAPLRVIGASDRLELSTNKNLSKPLSIDASGAEDDELLGLSRGKLGATCANNNGTSNNNASDQRQQQASVSPSSTTTTLTTTTTNSNSNKSPSPSVAATFGHDSGFQSINHDFNPSPNAEARKVSFSSTCNLSVATGAATITTETTPSNQSKTINGLEESTVTAPATSNCKTPTSTKDKVLASISRDNIDPVSGQLSKGSQEQEREQEQQQAYKSTASSQQRPAKTCSPGYIPLTTNTATTTDPKHRYPIDQIGQQPSDTSGACSTKTSVETDDQIDGVAKSASKSTNRLANRNFVRNSLPSRSVNFGHSRPTPGGYLDRIRASVTATTTTNTTSSFSEQTSNIVLAQQQQQKSQHVPRPAPYLLNCLLDHKHTERCFVKHMQQVGCVASVPNGHHGHSPVQSSRQLNALIDPVSQQRLMMSMLHHSGLPQRPLPPASANQQQQHHHHHHHLNHLYHAHRGGGAFDELKREEQLTEQQIAHLANLHHQHYYHHLHQMHQLHQLHHLHHHHHLQHKYQQQQHHHNQQQQQQGSSNHKPSVPTSTSCPQDRDTSPARTRPCEPIYTGGSQFYAPSLCRSFEQQTCTNTTPASPATTKSASQQQVNEHRNRLVEGGQQQHSDTSRSSPSRNQNARLSPNKSQQQQLNQYTLPQIDEVNGLPTVDVNHHQKQHHQHNQQQTCNSSEKLKTRNTSALIMPSAGVQDNSKQHSVTSATAAASNGSPPSSSSSPTSTSSSNLSPSSASSSSSLNSLSTSSAPLNRSALRHTSTDLNQRQFSIERELVSSTPMTATLSRIGSCRAPMGGLGASVCGKSNEANNSNNYTTTDQLVCSHHQQQLLQSPVKSQQPSMRNSKILNISQQSACAQKLAVQEQQQHLHQHQHQHQQHRLSLDGSGSVGGRRADFDKLLANNNLANIRLNDSLAFTSLRAPKNSSGLINLNRSLGGGGANGSGNGKSMASQQPPPAHNLKVSSSSLSPERQRKLNGTGNASAGIAGANIKTGQTNSSNSNKSSVWFEYGCV